MNEQRIREIAGQCSDFAEQIPFYRGVEDGLTWEAKIQKARDLKFAELIVQECVNVLHDNELWNRHISHALNEHFGVEP